MNSPMRIDLFDLTESTPLIKHGYYYLAKNPITTNKALPVLRVFAGNAPRHITEQYIIDAKLFNTIEDGDIGMSNGKGSIRVILSRRANHNTLLLTERCDNLCMFCSQPPKNRDDSWLLDLAEKAILDFNFNGVIGLSGGEPLLYGEGLFEMLKSIRTLVPQTSLHILSNGRAFKDKKFAQQIASLSNYGEIIFGIPLYAASAEVHDQLVGSQGAFRDTVTGLINAGNSGIPIELRIIPTKLNYQQIPALVEFSARVFSSLSQISIMNLEPTGWAKKNWLDLYMSPDLYADKLTDAIKFSKLSRIPVALFNYPRCHLPEKIRQFSVKSISDWKNYYPDECKDCLEKLACGGYFTSTNGERFDPPRSIQ